MTRKSDFQIALHYDGSFVRGHTITARTLGHSLVALQQMVDKAVMYEKRGSIKKYDVLPAVWYKLADLEVQPFEDGCIKIPLIGLDKTQVISLLKGLLYEPFQQAISDNPISEKSLVSGLSAAINRAAHKIDVLTHQQILDNSGAIEKRYFAEAIFRDFDKLIFSLRSSFITDKELISIELSDEMGSREYEFNRHSSRKFHKIVSAKQLGPTIEFSGRLTVFGEANSKYFPYFGKFFSKASNQEHKLLIHEEADIDTLRGYNTSHNDLNFLGAPVTAWGAFDELRGDIVFLKLNG